jgi:hypothetical protein
MSLLELYDTDSEYCIGCGATVTERGTILTYHDSDTLPPLLMSGYLCPLCKQQIEAILTEAHSEECERCSAPFPEAGRNRLLEFDEHDVLRGTRTLSNRCLKER